MLVPVHIENEYPRIALFAKKFIPPDTEIVYNYGHSESTLGNGFSFNLIIQFKGTSDLEFFKNKTYKKLLKKMGEKPSPLYGPALKADFVAEHAAFGKILASIGVKKK